MKKEKQNYVKFQNGNKTIIMKVLETLKNGDVRVIDGSVIEKQEILETIKI